MRERAPNTITTTKATAEKKHDFGHFSIHFILFFRCWFFFFKFYYLICIFASVSIFTILLQYVNSKYETTNHTDIKKNCLFFPFLWNKQNDKYTRTHARNSSKIRFTLCFNYIWCIRRELVRFSSYYYYCYFFFFIIFVANALTIYSTVDNNYKKCWKKGLCVLWHSCQRQLPFFLYLSVCYFFSPVSVWMYIHYVLRGVEETW